MYCFQHQPQQLRVTCRSPEHMGDASDFHGRKAGFGVARLQIVFSLCLHMNSSIVSKTEDLLIWKLLEKMKHQVATRLWLFLAQGWQGSGHEIR